MVPTYLDLVTTYLFHHFHEFLLVNRINRLNTDSGSFLGHREYINNSDSVVINDFSNHESHDFERDARARMLEHLQESQRRNVDLLRSIRLRHLYCLATLTLTGTTHLGLGKKALQIHFLNDKF